MKKIINTDQAPAAIGTYSQAVQVHHTVYISGQIPLDPASMTMASETFEGQAHQVFKNLKAVVTAAGGEFSQVVKLQIYLIDLNQFAVVNEVMAAYFEAPYPARAAVQVSRLPKDAMIEIDAVLQLDI